MKIASCIFVGTALVVLSACSKPADTEPKPELNCRVPVEPTVGVGVRVGSGGTDVGGGVVFDASGNNGVLDENGVCQKVETEGRIRIGIGF
ncbi:MAG: hypothetical protein AAGJ34_08545 [Pseudomonadota bacterium]